MDRSFIAQNTAERARLRALVERLTDADLSRPMPAGRGLCFRRRGAVPRERPPMDARDRPLPTDAPRMLPRGKLCAALDRL